MRRPPQGFLAVATVLLAAASVLGAGLDDLGPVPSTGVRVILVRHAQALSNLSPRPNLSPEELDHLTQHGREQARAVGHALRSVEVDVLLTSPARRAVETSEIVGASLGLEPRVDPGLRPLELGRARDGSPMTWPMRLLALESGRDPRPTAGESVADLGDRVRDVVQAARDAHPGGIVVLVAHSEVIGAFVGLVEGTPAPQRLEAVHVANGSLTVVDQDANSELDVRLLDHHPEGT